jgi:hypothetical protein
MGRITIFQNQNLALKGLKIGVYEKKAWYLPRF